MSGETRHSPTARKSPQHTKIAPRRGGGQLDSMVEAMGDGRPKGVILSAAKELRNHPREKTGCCAVEKPEDPSLRSG